MNDIRELLGAARRRLELTGLLGMLSRAVLVAAVIALALAIADRLPGDAFVHWSWVAPAMAVVAIGAGLLLWVRRRHTELDVALRVDERLDLRERLSTALHCEGRGDAFAQAAVQDAVATARDPRSREQVRRRFAVAAPSRWWIGPVVIVLAAVVLQLPQADLFAREPEADPDAVAQAQRESAESMEVLVESLEDKPELQAELAGLVDDLAVPGEIAEDVNKPEQVKRDALKKVTELNKRLDDILSGEKGKTAEALESMLSKLETPRDGEGQELADALSRGDFAGAKKALEEMLEQARNGDLNEQQKAELAEMLENIGKQLEQLAQQQERLEQALQQAGLNPQLANNPQALQQALQQAQNLNEQQRQQIQQMIQAQQAAQQMCQGLGGACMQMAQGMQGGQPGQAGQQMMDQLGQMEQLQQLLQQAQAAANQCQGMCQGLGQGMNLDQAMQKWGQGGMGQWGQGSGGKAPIAPTPSGTKMTKADTPLREGEIIASMLIDGKPVTGESKATLKKVVSAGAAGYDESLGEDPLPRQYHDAQKHYFGQLEEQVEAMTAPAPESGDAAEEADASDAGEPTNAPGD